MLELGTGSLNGTTLCGLNHIDQDTTDVLWVGSGDALHYVEQTIMMKVLLVSSISGRFFHIEYMCIRKGLR